MLRSGETTVRSTRDIEMVRLLIQYLCGLAIIGGVVAPAAAQQGATNGEWRSYGGDLGSTKYSPLAAIDATNFSKLEIAW